MKKNEAERLSRESFRLCAPPRRCLLIVFSGAGNFAGGTRAADDRADIHILDSGAGASGSAMDGVSCHMSFSLLIWCCG